MVRAACSHNAGHAERDRAGPVPGQGPAEPGTAHAVDSRAAAVVPSPPVGFGKLIGRPSRAAMPVAAPAICLVAALAVAGCGGGASTSQTSEAAHVFARNCSACHSLIGNESRHRQGGDLVGYRLSRQQLLEFTREMPTRRPLTSAQLHLVVEYVLGLQQRGRAR